MTTADAARFYAHVLRDARRSSRALTAASVLIVTALLGDLARRVAELSDETEPPSEARRGEIEREITRLLLLVALAMNEQLARAIERGVRGLAELHVEAHRELVREAGVPARPPDLQALPAVVDRRLTIIRGTARPRVINHHVTDALRSIRILSERARAEGIGTGQLMNDVSRALTRRTEPGPIAARYGVGERDITGLTSLRSDARRLAVSESASAARSANATALTESPIVVAAPWTLSPMHEPYDECDWLAEVNLYGLGRGMYAVDHWPNAPHPWCQCFMGEKVKVRRPDEWMDPKPPGPNVKVSVTEAIRLAGEDWSDRRQERLRRSVFAA